MTTSAFLLNSTIASNSAKTTSIYVYKWVMFSIHCHLCIHLAHLFDYKLSASQLKMFFVVAQIRFQNISLFACQMTFISLGVWMYLFYQTTDIRYVFKCDRNHRAKYRNFLAARCHCRRVVFSGKSFFLIWMQQTSSQLFRLYKNLPPKDTIK